MMHARCMAKTKSNLPCKGRPLPGSRFCLAHDPERQCALAESRKRGGLARANTARASKQWRHLADDLQPQEIPTLLLSVGLAAVEGHIEPKQATAFAVCARAAIQVAEAAMLEERIRLLERITDRLERGGHE